VLGPVRSQSKIAVPAAVIIQGTRQGSATEPQKGRKGIIRPEQSCQHSGVVAKPPVPFSVTIIRLAYCVCVLLGFLIHASQLPRNSVWEAFACIGVFSYPVSATEQLRNGFYPCAFQQALNVERVLLSTRHYRKSRVEH